jgi:ADP-ribose pyrophosphatase YjhB (NUDIX family)
MAISPFLARIRSLVGNELLILPSVAVLPWDPGGRLLMVRDVAIDCWVTVGGMIEPGESPRDAAVREAREETGLQLEITRLREVVGGPEYQVTYPNGDQVAYVSPVFDARVLAGEPRPDGEEVAQVGWFSPAEIERELELNDFTRALLRDAGIIPGPRA